MSGLASFMELHREDLAQRFADRLYATTASSSLDRESVIDSMREFVDELVIGLRAEAGSTKRELRPEHSETASEHARQRFQLGYDVGAMVREYAALEDILFGLMEEAGQTFATWELRLLTMFVMSGAADATTRYAHERDEQLTQQAAKHVGFLAHELRNPLSSMSIAFSLLQSAGALTGSPRAVVALERGLTKLRARGAPPTQGRSARLLLAPRALRLRRGARGDRRADPRRDRSV